MFSFWSWIISRYTSYIVSEIRFYCYNCSLNRLWCVSWSIWASLSRFRLASTVFWRRSKSMPPASFWRSAGSLIPFISWVALFITCFTVQVTPCRLTSQISLRLGIAGTQLQAFHKLSRMGFGSCLNSRNFDSSKVRNTFRFMSFFIGLSNCTSTRKKPSSSSLRNCTNESSRFP